MGTIKNRNDRDLVDTEEIKKRWKEYTKELGKKDLNELDFYDGVVSHPEPDILEKVTIASGMSRTKLYANCSNKMGLLIFWIRHRNV